MASAVSKTVSVNIMSYRYGHLGGHALESVLTQTRLPDHITVVDDGVGDCDWIATKYPDVEFIKQPRNLGIVPNFNFVLQQTKTDQVLFLGADNWLEPEALEKLAAHDADIVSCDAWIWGEGKLKYWSLPFQPHGSALYNVALAKQVGGYAASGNEHTEEDSVLFKRMMEAGATFKHVAEPLLCYRRHQWNFNK